MIITKQYDFGYSFASEEPQGTAPRIPKGLTGGEIGNWIKGFNQARHDRSVIQANKRMTLGE